MPRPRRALTLLARESTAQPPAGRLPRSPREAGQPGITPDIRVAESEQGARPSGPDREREPQWHLVRMECLTKADCLWQSLFTAATGRRAVEHPPQPGFHWRRGFALSVFDVTGHLRTPRRWGARV